MLHIIVEECYLNPNCNSEVITSLTQTYNIRQHSKAKNTLFLIRNRHSHIPPHSHYNGHKGKHAPYTHINCL